MEEIVKFLKEAETYYLATVEGDQPRVRPFGTAHIFEGKLYIQTGKKKDVSKQLHANPKAELCAFKGGEWIRVAGELVEDDRVEARQSMLDAYPGLKKMYAADDGNTEVFYFKNGVATISSFTHEPKVIKFWCYCRVWNTGSCGAEAHTVYFEGLYIVCNENKNRSVTQNELIKNTSYCNHRI